jgi:hypothetical protein
MAVKINRILRARVLSALAPIPMLDVASLAYQLSVAASAITSAPKVRPT